MGTNGAEDPPKTEIEELGDPRASLRDCFRLASFQDLMILFLGLFFSFFNGIAYSMFAIVIGLAISSYDIRYTQEEFKTLVLQSIRNFVVMGVSIFIGTICSRTLLRLNSQRQGFKFRQAYLKALLNQEIAIFDKVNPMEFSSQVEKDCSTVSNALDIQLEMLFWYFGSLSGSIAIAFGRSWQIALMVFVAIPVMLGLSYLYDKTIARATVERSKAYAKAGTIAEEALTNIKTVVSLGGEKAELERYNSAVSSAQQVLSKNGMHQGLTFGAQQFFFYGFAAVIFYIGSVYIQNGEINPNTGEVYILTDFYTPLNALLVAFSQLPMLGPCLGGLNAAKQKARKILDVVEKTQTHPDPQTTINNFQGNITFNNVCFAYPTNPHKPILQNSTFHIEARSKVALVGESGSGKSTIIQLLQKFYEPKSGTIEFDGSDIKTLDAKWIRENIAYVGQEPVLFSMTVRENLLLAKEDATEDQLIEALKKANAYEFVMDLEQKLDTFVGGGVSAQLSGGQKQRIAIARALLRDAKILLLDEATSALDRISEKEVQDALDKLAKDRTIIIVAHRLSTIQQADSIIVFNQGMVEEVGNHQQLMAKKGKYFQLQSSHELKPEEQKKPADLRQTRRDFKINKGPKKFRSLEEVGISDDHEDFPLLGDKSESESSRQGHTFFGSIRRLWKLAKIEKKYFYLGSFGAVGAAAANPLINIFFSAILDVLVAYDDPNYRERVNLILIGLALSGLLLALFIVLQFGFFSKASEILTQTLRSSVFYKFLRMHIGWHDDPKNSPGTLTKCLEIDASSVGQMTGMSLGLILQILLTNVFTILFAVAVCWQLGLIGALAVPVLMYVAFKLNSNNAEGEEKSGQVLAKTDVLISETINNMKTVVSLNAQDQFLAHYNLIIQEYHDIGLAVKIKNSFLEGALFLVINIDIAYMYYFGSYLFTTLELTPFRIFFVVFGVAITAISSTQLFVLLPDVGRATNSVKKVFECLDLRSEIDIEDKRHSYCGRIQGNIEFRNVGFSYPTRDVHIFHALSFKIEAGKQIGITGPSGCGKSTIMQLLLRLYDPDKGEILIEDINIKEYDLQYLRKKIGIVSQEPVLFYGSIEYNLKFANPDVSDGDMREAAKKANALEFIEKEVQSEAGEEEQKSEYLNFASAPPATGFQRIVGAKGGQLSGGQKQRIAIARAILRRPKILLLDEATSALDSKNEHVVKEAISNISQGLTTISVAHRLSTLQDLSEILVLKDGMIVERGTFDQLIRKKGYFYQLEGDSEAK